MYLDLSVNLLLPAFCKSLTYIHKQKILTRFSNHSLSSCLQHFVVVVKWMSAKSDCLSSLCLPKQLSHLSEHFYLAQFYLSSVLGLGLFYFFSCCSLPQRTCVTSKISDFAELQRLFGMDQDLFHCTSQIPLKRKTCSPLILDKFTFLIKSTRKCACSSKQKSLRTLLYKILI